MRLSVSDICAEKWIPLIAPSTFFSPSLPSPFSSLFFFHSVFLIPNSNCLFLPLLSVPNWPGSCQLFVKFCEGQKDEAAGKTGPSRKHFGGLTGRGGLVNGTQVSAIVQLSLGFTID